MSTIGREAKVQDHQLKLLERLTVAVERLADDPVIEMEVAPPVCPNCHLFNPTVATSEAAGTGPMVELYVEMKCQNCDTTFWGAPVQWSVHSDIENLRGELQERAEHVKRVSGNSA